MSEELAEASTEGSPPDRRGSRRRSSRRVIGRKGEAKAAAADPSAMESGPDKPSAGEPPSQKPSASRVASFAGEPQGGKQATAVEPAPDAGEPQKIPAAESEPPGEPLREGRPRSRRRPSRSRPKAAVEAESGANQESEAAPVTAISPAPALPQPETEAKPARPETREPGADQAQRSRVPRRRRRGAPRRDRNAALQIQSAPLKMLIAAGRERNQIAVLRERELIEHYVSHDEDRSIVGNIYLGRVQNVLPGMEAAFLDIGETKNAVLYAGEVSFDEDIEGPPPRIESMLKSGQAVLAQVTKDPMGSKGARLTTEVSLAGRYVVLVPGAESMGISRRLPDEERKRLRDIANRVRPAGHGLIVRTAADGVSESDLEGDIKRLARIWGEIDEKRKSAKPPKLLYSEPDLAIRGIRDLFTSDVLQVIVDDEVVFGQIRDYLAEVAPALADRVELHRDEIPLFEKFGVVEQLRKAIDRKIWLKSGGHIVIDRTEAMTVIDVNTGRFVGKSNLETTVLHANLEAAEEIAKQLRLRDIGGIIVIDFIDMMHERNRQELVRTFEAALQRDKTRTQVFNISELGLLQMTRKNVSEGLLEAFSHICEHCEGRGIILTDLN